MTTPRGLGTDLVDISRIRAMLDDKGEAFKSKCFSEQEQHDADRTGAPRDAERYAARFAAKEAVLKALGTGWASGIAWTDVQIHTESSGAPRVVLSGRAAEIAKDQGVTGWLCSLTHTDHSAAATVIAIG